MALALVATAVLAGVGSGTEAGRPEVAQFERAGQVIIAGAGLEIEGPYTRTGGVAEVDVSLVRHVSLQFMGRGRHYYAPPDPDSADFWFYDATVGIRLNLREPTESLRVLPFIGLGGGIEIATIQNLCPGGQSRSESYGMLYANIGVDLFLPAWSHLGLRLLVRGDLTRTVTSDAGGAVLVIVRF